MPSKKQELMSPKQVIDAKKKTILAASSNRKFDGSRFLNSFMLAVAENRDLATALTDPRSQPSVINSLKRAATTGLSLNPQEMKAGIQAYYSKNKGQWVVNYQIYKNGMIELAMATGKVLFLDGDSVYENDDFQIQKGIDGDKYSHSPALRDRGEIMGFYAGIRLDDGQTKVAWMTRKQVEDHRDQYAGTVKSGSAWSSSFEGMGIKTVIKKLLRNIHLPTVSEAITIDDSEEAEIINVEAVQVEQVDKSQAEKITDKIQETFNTENEPTTEEGTPF